MSFKILPFVTILACSCSLLIGQGFQRQEVIGPYVYNFAKNIQWPNESSINEYHFTVITTDAALQTEFNKLAKTKTLKGKPIKVTLSNKPTIGGNTQLVFLGHEFESDLIRVLGEIESKNILLITDRFADRRYVMINFVQHESGKLQFEINKANIISQNLSIGPLMIMLGGSEIDVASLYKESQLSLLRMRKNLDSMASSLGNLSAKIARNENEIETQNKLVAEQSVQIQKQQEDLNKQRENLLLLQREATNKSSILNSKNEELKAKEEKLANQEIQIQKGEGVLKSLNATKDSLNASILDKEKVLNLQGYTIASQNKILFGLAITIILALFSTFMLLNWYRQKNRLNQLLTTQNEELTQSQEEIATQRDMVAQQNKELEKSRLIIEHQNEEIRKRNENLEDEVEKRTKELVEYNQQLEQFAFISAHNLRAPVARILGLGNLLEFSETQDEKLISKKLIATTRELDRVVKDLNTILEIKKNNTSVITEVNLNDEWEMLKINLEKEIADTQAIIEADFSGVKSIRTVRPYLDSIFINLISNSIKYRHPDRAPHININTEVKDNYVCLIISDNGLGINLKLYREKLFKLYSRFHDHVEGKGLGLYLVKTQITALGGRLEIESEVNVGTRFYVYLKVNT